MNETRPAVNWQVTHSRLEQTRRTLEAGGSPLPEEVKRILRGRAQALAKPLVEVRTSAEVLDLLVFSLPGERYGIETAHVRGVISLRELTPVPCTPPVILGVVNHRGCILPVLDLRRLFNLPGQGITEGGRVVAVEAGGMTFGIFADAVAGSIRVAAHEIAPPPATLSAGRQACIRSITGEMIAVLDLEALTRDPRIVVNDEVGG
ncbi:MAG: purine-binding chemotaxis protein CheW [candidate division NC10 bacterium]|nr:purine-binding chemotaxis protein CheW [candidate division NC10 bacterium]MDE2322661.1 purine-binding chemotaxis protein CheW [candidate division NC10 bacterium]